MENLNNHEKIVIDDIPTYEEFIWEVLGCIQAGDSLVIYKDHKRNICFTAQNFLPKCKKDDPNLEILYISEYIEKTSNKKEKRKAIDKVIKELKGKANIYIDEDSAEGESIAPDISFLSDINLGWIIFLLMILGTLSFIALLKISPLFYKMFL